ncbi:hypothetical protein FD723_32875 (plasmid) [Nostoc sp. C052]|nr:hypothetical protein FD723_32875 [Nostoc sp. C052]
MGKLELRGCVKDFRVFVNKTNYLRQKIVMNIFLKLDKKTQFKALFLLVFIPSVWIILPPILYNLFPLSFSNESWDTSSVGLASIGMMTRGQQRYFLEHNGIFSKSIPEIDIALKEQMSNSSKNYNYSIKITPISAFNYANPRREYVKKGWFVNIPVIGYVSGVFIIPNTKNSKNELTTFAIICQNKLPGTIHLSEPIYQNGILTCGSGTIKLQKPK